MRIGLYSPFLDENIGGGERYLLTIAEHLGQNHQVEIFLRAKKAKSSFLTKYGKKFNLDLKKVKLMPAPFSSLSFPKRLKLTAQYDAFLYLTDGSFFFSQAKRNIVHFQIPFPHKPAGWFNNLKLNNWTIKVANSLFTKKVLEEKWGVKIDFIHRCGPDIKVFKPLKKKNIILNVGRFFSPQGFKHCKKQDFLVETFKLMCDQGLQNWQLILNGPIDKGEDNLAYAQKVAKLAKNYPIIIRHQSSFRQLLKDYGQASIYWHATGFGLDEQKYPQAMEHLGLSTIEAMAAQAVPVVIKKGGQKEIVDQEKNGYLWLSQKQLIKYTQKLINNNQLKQKLGKEAGKKASQFSKTEFNKVTDKIFKLR